jgi:ketosteroid isomerase-like protein
VTVSNADLVRGKKVADLRALLAPDAEWWVSGSPERLPFAGTFRGPEGFDHWRSALSAAVTYERFRVADEIASGDEVVHIIDAAGHANATGRPYASQVVRVFTVRDGRIVRVRSYFDTAAYEAALRP